MNTLSTELLEHELLPGFSLPAKHSGELFGVAYLYAQAGKALHFSEDGLEEEEEEEEDVTTEEACRLDEEVVPDIPPAADSDTSDSGGSDVSEFFTNDLQFCIFFKIYDSQFMRNRHLSLLITASPFVTGRLTVGRGRFLTGCRPSRHRRLGPGGQACRVSPVDIWPVCFEQSGMYSLIVFPLAVFLACGVFSFSFHAACFFFCLNHPQTVKKTLKELSNVQLSIVAFLCVRSPRFRRSRLCTEPCQSSTDGLSSTKLERVRPAGAPADLAGQKATRGWMLSRGKFLSILLHNVFFVTVSLHAEILDVQYEKHVHQNFNSPHNHLTHFFCM